MKIESVLTLLMMAVLITLAVRGALSQKGLSWKSILHVLGSTFLIIGIVGFLGTIFSATTGLGPFDSVEWPIGVSSGALKYPDGTIAVPQVPSGRVQIYDQSLQYLRGWHVEANGGLFKLYPASDTSFYVYTVRGHMKYQYDLSGTLISADPYVGLYPEDSEQTSFVSIPTPFYSYVFIHPFASWIVFAFGMVLTIKADAIPKKRKKRSK